MKTSNDNLPRLLSALLLVTVATCISIGCITLGLPKVPVMATLGAVCGLVNLFILAW